MKNIFILAIVILCISCNNDAESQQADAIFAHINVHLKNSAGENILGTDKYPKNKINADYLINGKIIQNASNAIIPDNPNNVYFVTENNLNHFILFLNYSATEEYPITYLHWNGTETDTIKTKYRRESGNDGNVVVLEKVWLNDVLVWEVEKQGQTNSDITIVK